MQPVRAASRLERGPLPIAAGIGLRFQHHHDVLETVPDIGWLEVHSENYMGGGPMLADLLAVRRDIEQKVLGFVKREVFIGHAKQPGSRPQIVPPGVAN